MIAIAREGVGKMSAVTIFWFEAPTTFNVVELDVLVCAPTCIALAIEEGAFAVDGTV